VRRAGVLLHPTSLPGPYGIGEIGPSARRFLAWLESAGQSIWQMLPLGPVDPDTGSPYASPSAFARNPLLLSMEDLVADGWLRDDERPFLYEDRSAVDFRWVARTRTPALRLAADRVRGEVALAPFAAEHAWADTWALYAAIAESQGTLWTKWPDPLRHRDPHAIAAARDQHRVAYERHLALQWLFSAQWARLRAEAFSRGISLWGDVPFFVSGEGCDTWADRELFRLDAHDRPTAISGVPPDAFSATGQLWGHPLYDEAAHHAQGYRWWTERIGAALDLFDAIRLDHFRGVQAYWEVAPDAPDAMDGRWIPGPGQPMLDAVRATFGGLPLIAEDLGVITPDVEALRDENALPGMAILQFAFGGATGLAGTNEYLPHHHRRRLVVYPGTHDNDTIAGWYAVADEVTRDHVRRYLLVDGHDIAHDLVRCAYRSVADTAVASMQDLLGLGGHARMNVPGQAAGNWAWRMGSEALTAERAAFWRAQVAVAGRLPVSVEGETKG
jgi:4-alpha-glucanotransferase